MNRLMILMRAKDDEGVDGAEGGAPELLPELLSAGIRAAQTVIREDADEKGAEIATHAVHGEHVEGIVEIETCS